VPNVTAAADGFVLETALQFFVRVKQVCAKLGVARFARRGERGVAIQLGPERQVLVQGAAGTRYALVQRPEDGEHAPGHA
jgi:hypothetical protein